MMGWQWHQPDHMQSFALRSRQITMPARHHSKFLRAGCPSCRPTNSVKALKARLTFLTDIGNFWHITPLDIQKSANV